MSGKEDLNIIFGSWDLKNKGLVAAFAFGGMIRKIQNAQSQMSKINFRSSHQKQKNNVIDC